MRARILALAAFLTIGALLAWPLRESAAYLDDHVFLVFARHLDSPWPLLLQDALGTFFFRPVALAVWWLSGRFIDGAPGQAMLAVAMHVTNGALLTLLLRRLGVGAGAALLAGTLFVAHPTPFAATAWLSDRFDLLAAGFGLAALAAFDAALQRPKVSRWAAALGLLALALLSKETAFAFVPCAFILVARRGGMRGQLPWLAGIAAVAFAVLAVRPLVLRFAADPFLAPGLLAVLSGGMSKWLAYLPAWALVDAGPAIGRGAWLAALAILAAAAAFAHRAGFRIPRVALYGGVLLAASSAALQSPVINASPLVPFAGTSTFEAVAGSRFYYIPFLGLAAMLAALAHPAVEAASAGGSLLRWATTALAIVMAVSLLAASRAVGREWVASIAAGEFQFRMAAVEVVRGMKSPPRGCKVYFLGTPPEQHDFRAFVDTAVKAALPRGHPALGCLLQSEHTPWYHVAARGAFHDREVRPLEVILFEGRPYPPLPVGNLTLYFLKAIDAAAIAADPAARFFAWRASRFDEVSTSVRDGTYPVRFYDNR